MRDTVFIRLAEDGSETAAWLRSAATGDQTSVQQAPASGPLTEAAAECAGRRVVVFVPGTEVLLTRTAIPTRNRQRIVQALPYLLEDQLVSDVERLHFAAGARDAAGMISVAVVDRDRMQRWLETLRAAGIEPDALIPDILALPLAPGTWTVLLDGATARVRTAAYSGFAVDRPNLETVIRRALGEAGEHRPARLVVYGDGGEDATDLAALDIPLERPAQAADPLVLMARHFSEQQAINLLQGAYSRREQLGRLWRPWLPSAALLVALLLLNAGMSIADYLRLSRESRSLEDAMARIYLQTFPEARRVVNPRVQMEQRLAALRKGGAGGADGFLDMLHDAARPLSESGDLDLKRISYRSGQLDLALVLKDLQSLDALKQRLTAAGLAVDIQSASAFDGGVEARLRLARQAP